MPRGQGEHHLKTLARGVRKGTRVRCLGVGPEHTFRSHHASERICPKCRSKIDASTRGCGRAVLEATPVILEE